MTYSEHSSRTEPAGRIVVVVDNPDVRQMLVVGLEAAGFDVVTASGEVDLRRRLTQARPDLVLIDMQRSEGDGLPLVKRLRSRYGLRNVPILFLAGSDSDLFRHRVRVAGADAFGLRPIGMVELQHRVSELVAGRSRPTAPMRRRGRVS